MKTSISSLRASCRHPIALLTLTLACILLSCADGATADNRVGGKADFRLKTLDGAKRLGPADFKGQVVVVDFWATWCLPCRAQAKELEPVVRDLKGRGVQFLGASVGEDPGVVREFLKSKPAPYPTLVDPEDEISVRLNIQALPTLMVVDKTGKIAYFHAGITYGDTLRQLIKKAGA
jgi:thiol-disulfide isomerase/thioredoxin